MEASKAAPAGPIKRKPLRVTVTEIDQEILRLLARRHNLLAKMRKNGRLDPSEEKFIREAWQNDVARISHDPELSGRFFALMQQISFLPKPSAPSSSASVPGSQRRDAFNLAPPQMPVQINMTAPCSWRETCLWVYLAAASGQQLRLANCLQNDPVIDCVKGLVQMGGGISREDDAIRVKADFFLDSPDKVIHVGDEPFVLYLFIAHYLGRHGRVKFAGDTRMQLGDFSVISHLLPLLGGRMVHIVPHSSGLPVRLETSGILPPGIDIPPDCPPDFAEALLIAAPGYPAPFAINLSNHPARESILSHVLPILQQAAAQYALQGNTLTISPSALKIPENPAISAEPELAAFLLSFASILSGACELQGTWPDWPETNALWNLCAIAQWQRTPTTMLCKPHAPLSAFQLDAIPESLPPWHTPLLAALAASAALHSGTGSLPLQMLEDATMQDYLRVVGLSPNEQNQLVPTGNPPATPWNAPTSAWALAMALTACSRPSKAGWPLGNPGIVTTLWPQFWQLYNSLPAPRPRLVKSVPTAPEPKKRRRIITNAAATLPIPKDEDW